MATLTKKTKLAILRRAREILAPRGAWVKGNYEVTLKDGNQRHCLVGAVNAAAREVAPKHYSYPGQGDLVDNISLRSFVAEKVGGGDLFMIEDWNDAPSRRKKDVLGALDEYIAKVEAK